MLLLLEAEVEPTPEAPLRKKKILSWTRSSRKKRPRPPLCAETASTAAAVSSSEGEEEEGQEPEVRPVQRLFPVQICHNNRM